MFKQLPSTQRTQNVSYTASVLLFHTLKNHLMKAAYFSRFRTRQNFWSWCQHHFNIKEFSHCYHDNLSPTDKGEYTWDYKSTILNGIWKVVSYLHQSSIGDQWPLNSWWQTWLETSGLKSDNFQTLFHEGKEHINCRNHHTWTTVELDSCSIHTLPEQRAYSNQET